MKRLRFLVPAILFVFSAAQSRELAVGSKKFTESVILGELLRLRLAADERPAVHRSELGGTRILWNALKEGNIDAYPEYTGTIEEELLQKKFGNLGDLRRALAPHGIGATQSLGFNNTYALGMKKSRAAQLGISRISDLARYPRLAIGFSEEFRRRQDGWPGLRKHYRLPQRFVRGLDHDIAYRALESGDIDLTDLYSTDASIGYYDLLVLEDDRAYFPRYDALYLYRLATAEASPEFLQSLTSLEGRISADEMAGMNREVTIDRRPESAVAADFLSRRLSIQTQQTQPGLWDRLVQRSGEHLKLVLLSLCAAVLAAVPLGVFAARHERTGRALLSVIGVIQTIPALALLVVLITPLNMLGLSGIGDTPALIALFLYSLLPIVRGTHTGVLQIPLALRETAAVLGLSPKIRLWRIELPLALPSILSGIKTAAVLNVGFATLGALVGAGGFGQPILTGIRLDSYALILEGAVPSALLAIVMQLIFDRLEHALVSPGLRK